VDRLWIGIFGVFLYNLFMKFSLLTYNILFNKALPYLAPVLNEYHPDIICLQEIDTREENLKELEKCGYKLADFANCFIEYGQIWGVATYYNPDKLELMNSKPIKLINGFYEFIKLLSRLFRDRGLSRKILNTNFRFKTTKKDISIYNVHLSAISLNGLRIKQLNTLDFEEIEKKGSVIMTGDFNFPVERKKLEKIMTKHHLKEATNNIFYTLKYPPHSKNYQYGFLQGLFSRIARLFWTDEIKLDYIFYRGLKNTSTKRLDFSYSDHFPVITQFEI